MNELELELVEIKPEEDKLQKIQETINIMNTDLKEIYEKLSARQDRVLNRIKNRKLK